MGKKSPRGHALVRCCKCAPAKSHAADKQQREKKVTDHRVSIEPPRRWPSWKAHRQCLRPAQERFRICRFCEPRPGIGNQVEDDRAGEAAREQTGKPDPTAQRKPEKD